MNSQGIKNNLYKEIVSKLSEDGAVCNYDTREYDEKDTFDGGNNLRKEFKRINDKITSYHRLLEVISGERRANITESIPVIDYLNKENTGFKNYYTDNNFTQIEEIPQPAETDSVLKMLVNEDPYFLNRALLGQDQKLHFFNTTADVGNCNNILVSDSSLDKRELVYKGSKGRRVVNTTGDFENILDESLGNIIQSVINTEKLVCVSVDKSLEDSQTFLDSFESEEDTSSNSLFLDFYMVVKLTPLSKITKEDLYDIELGTDIEADSDKDAYYLNSYITSSGSGNSSIALKTQNLDKDYESFILNSISKTNISDFSSFLEEDVEINIPLINGDVVFVIQAPRASTVENTKVLLFRKFGDDYKLFTLIVDSFSFSNTLTIKEIDYNTILAKEFERYYIVPQIKGNPRNKDSKEVFYLSTLTMLQRLLFLEEQYTSSTSGLLLGKFCEPILAEDASILGMGAGKTVSKWKFLDNSKLYYKYHKNSNNYNVGTIYTNENIFGRGIFRESPLKLTPEMAANLGCTYNQTNNTYTKLLSNGETRIIKGYATYMYTRLEQYVDVFTLLNKHFVNVETDSWWKNTTNKKALDQIVTLEDTNTKKSSKNLIHINKFLTLGRDINTEDIDKLINSWFEVPSLNKPRFETYSNEYTKKEKIPGPFYKLYIDARGKEDTCVEKDDATRSWILFIPITSGRDDVDFQIGNYLKDMHSNLSYLWQATYTHLVQKFLFWTVGTTYFNRLRINCISPLELFLNESASSTRTILVYPSTKEKLPNKMYLISKDNLNLEVNKPCSFWKPNVGIVTLKVIKSHAFLPSKIRKVFVKDYQSSKEVEIGGYYEKSYTEDGTEPEYLTFYFNGTGAADSGQDGGSVGYMKDKDCWIYELEFIEVDIPDFEYYDANNNLIKDTGLDAFDLKPMAYPSTFFKCISNNTNTEYYLSNPDNLSSLKDSIIVKGIPAKYKKDSKGNLIIDEFATSEAFYEKLKINGKSLKILGDFLISKEGTFNRLSQKFMQTFLNKILSTCSLTRSFEE